MWDSHTRFSYTIPIYSHIQFSAWRLFIVLFSSIKSLSRSRSIIRKPSKFWGLEYFNTLIYRNKSEKWSNSSTCIAYLIDSLFAHLLVFSLFTLLFLFLFFCSLWLFSLSLWFFSFMPLLFHCSFPSLLLAVTKFVILKHAGTVINWFQDHWSPSERLNWSAFTSTAIFHWEALSKFREMLGAQSAFNDLTWNLTWNSSIESTRLHQIRPNSLDHGLFDPDKF